ncbi:MAG: hypothetical protein ACLQHF_11355 [Terracidiphilus sp.]
MKLVELLAKWPLYRKLRFKNDTLHNYPEIVRAHCPTCSGDRNFDQFSWEGMKTTRRGQGPFGPEQFTTTRGALRTLSYRCPDCKQFWVSYIVHWRQRLEGEENVVQKCGQFPEIDTVIDPDLQKSISPADIVLLKKAITSRNFNSGLASVAYLRRVVENQVEPLIVRLVEDHKEDSGELQARIKKARADRGFRGLLDLAGKNLPEYLKPGGINPLVPLHKLASEGVHNLPEDECIEIFDESIVVFSFVFRELHRHQSEVKSFAESLKKIAQA